MGAAALCLTGIVVGAGGAVAAERLLRSFVAPGVGSARIVFGAVSAALVAVASTVAYVPARRASRVDPMVALRDSM